jgi:hypothetical protein
VIIEQEFHRKLQEGSLSKNSYIAIRPQNCSADMNPAEELTHQELGKRVDELARRYAETHDEQVSRTVTSEPMPSGVAVPRYKKNSTWMQ